MKIIRKRKIILERTRRIIFQFGNESSETFCRDCEKPVRFITIDQAAAACEITSREIFGLVEKKRVHFQETRQGRLIICLDSLINLTKKDGNFLSEGYE